MIIGIAGPYSAPTEAQRKMNLDALNSAAASVLLKGHIPLVGINAALPVLEKYEGPDSYEAIMAISLVVVDSCDALLLLAESPGANRERDLVLGKGLPVYRSIAEVPENDHQS
jgi:hypothetical protein